MTEEAEAFNASEPIGGVSHLALGWLRGVLRAEFASAPDFSRVRAAARAASEAAGESGAGGNRIPEWMFSCDPFDVAARYARGDVETAMWYRGWHQRWRRFRLPNQMAAFAEQMDRAQCPQDVYTALSEHAVQIVGGYTCLLFPPQGDAPLRPIPNHRLHTDAGQISLSSPLPRTGLIEAGDVLTERSGPLSNLAPLFSQERAVSLAHAPFAESGVILLVERRHERVFEQEDWDLLHMLAAQAGAALARVRLAERIDVLSAADPRLGLENDAPLAPVLDHAWTVLARGEPLTIVALRLEGLQRIAEQDGASAVTRVRRTASEVLRELSGVLGLVRSHGADGYLLILPRLTPRQAESLMERFRRQLPARVRVQFGIAGHGPETRSVEELVRRAEAGLQESAAVAAGAGAT